MCKYIVIILHIYCLLPSPVFAQFQGQVVATRTVCVGDIVTIVNADFLCNNGLNTAPSVAETGYKSLSRINQNAGNIQIQGNEIGPVYAQNTCNGALIGVKINFIDCDTAECLGPNLIPNPSFDIIAKCVPFRSAITGIAASWLDYPHWGITQAGSCDFYHDSCPNTDTAARKFANFNRPRTGKGMIGGYLFEHSTYSGALQIRNEYPIVKLNQELIVGKTYKVRLHAKNPNAPFVNSTADRIGVGFFAGQPKDFFRTDPFGGNHYIGELPKVQHPANSFITDTLFWTKVEGVFVADKPYTHMIFGNLSGISISIDKMDSYYFYDDISLKALNKIERRLTQADTIVCKGGTAVVGLTTNADVLTLKNKLMNKADSVALNKPIGVPNVTQKTCFQLFFQMGNCRDTFDFCADNYPNYDTLIEHFSCQLRDTGLTVNSLRTFRGCDSLVSVRTNLVSPITVDLGQDTVADVGSRFNLVPILRGDTATTFFWQPSLGLSCTNCPNPEVVLPQTMRYSLTVKNRGGCTSRAERLVQSLDKSFVYVPTAFSPNGDGTNETLTVYANPNRVELIRKLSIFDRWGNLLFTNNNFLPNDEKAGWDGLFKGKEVSPDVYVYVVEFLLFDKQIKTVSGDVTVIF
jgi:gliding motility-associated-like protein